MKKAKKKADIIDQSLETAVAEEQTEQNAVAEPQQVTPEVAPDLAPEQAAIVRVQAEGKKDKKSKKDKKEKKDKKGKKQDLQDLSLVADAQENAQPEEESSSEVVALASDSTDNAIVQDENPSDVVSEEGTQAADKQPKTKKKKHNKVGFYFSSLMKFYNPITFLPITCLLYVVFFAADIADGKGISFFSAHKLPIIVLVSIMAVALIVWGFITMRSKRVCSLDAFLLIGTLVGFGMILQCVILQHFSPFNELAIMTIALTAFVLVLMTIRIAIFKPVAQENANDAVYTAKNKLMMYFKVVFTKYAAFIVMLALVGILIIYIVTQSPMLENFEYIATDLEVVVTAAFAGAAIVMMVIALFIRLVRGRANLVDCMPYIFVIVAIGTLLYYFISKIYMYMYLAIACGIIGILWLVLCQYTLKMSIYKKDTRAHVVINKPESHDEEPQEEIEEPTDDEPVYEPIEEPKDDEPVVEPIEEPKDEEPVAEPLEEPVEEPIEEPIEEPQDEPVVEPLAEVAEPVEEPVEEVIAEPQEEPKQEPVVQTIVHVIEEHKDEDDSEINERLANIENNLVALMNQRDEKDEDDDEDEEDEEEEEDITAIKSVRPRMTFMTKLRLASDDLKAFYTEIKNELLSYGFRNRISKTKENFNHSRDTKARLVINGKTMKLYLALDPASLDEKYYHHKDMSEKKGVAEIPTMMPVRSKLAVKKAKELITKLAESCQLEKKPRYKTKDFSEELSSEGMTLTERKGYGYLVRDSITLEQAQQLPDELAEQLADVYTEENKFMRFIKTTVSLDDIVGQFDDGDVVTIDSIREGGIGVQNANYLIIEDGQVVNKKLKVYVDEITPNAVKMIALAGGEVYRIWRKR